MYIVINEYEVRENDITNGGTDFPVAIICVSKMVKVDKDTIKRVYRDNGTYYYPGMLENHIQKKKELYFKNCVLTGSSGGT